MPAPKKFAILCERVLAGEPILYACRDEPDEDTDSGWQLLCGSDDHGDGGQESGHLGGLEHFEDLQRIFELPVGAIVERSSDRHAWERTDLEDPPEGEFVCHSCGETHEELPIDYGYDAPDAYFDEEQFPRRHWQLTADTATFRDGEREHFFVRGVLEVPLLDAVGPLCYGVWVTASPDSFAAIETLEPADEWTLEGPFFGWFQNELPGYPDTMGLKANTWVRGGDLRPLIQLEPTDHPLSVDHRQGISLARLHEFVANW